MSAAAEQHPADDFTLAEIRTELRHLVALADSAERPKPTAINPAGHIMPGYEWLIEQRTFDGRHPAPSWWVRTVDDSEGVDAVFVSSPDAMDPGGDFIAMFPEDARRLALALLAAADRADHQTVGVPRLEDRRNRPKKGDQVT